MRVSKTSSKLISCKKCKTCQKCHKIGMFFPYLCDEGMVCDTEALSLPNAPCPPGHQCPLGTCTGDPFTEEVDQMQFKPLPCPMGSQCTSAIQRHQSVPDDPYSPQFCIPGFSNPLSGQNECVQAPLGHEVKLQGSTLNKVCGLAAYRDEDSTECKTCPEGTFGGSQASRHASDCALCRPGLVCNCMGLVSSSSGASGSNRSDCSQGCMQGKVCPSGTNREVQSNNACPSGFFCPEITRSVRDSYALKCPAGRSCTSGTGVLGIFNQTLL